MIISVFFLLPSFTFHVLSSSFTSAVDWQNLPSRIWTVDRIFRAYPLSS